MHPVHGSEEAMSQAKAVKAASRDDDAQDYAIQVRNLNFYYGAQHALIDIDMACEKNTVTAIIGASGCGKSTFLRTINRVYQKYPGHRATGEVLFRGRNILGDGTDLQELRARIGMVFQRPTPFEMSIFDNIAFAVDHYEGLSKADMADRVEESLRGAALWDEVKDSLRKNALTLSGGQQQRLCIARAIALKPEILLFDEPTSALDPASTQKIERLVWSLREHYTVLIVTHNLQQARRLSQYTAFFQDGRLIEFGDTFSMFADPQQPETAEYLHHDDEGQRLRKEAEAARQATLTRLSAEFDDKITGVIGNLRATIGQMATTIDTFAHTIVAAEQVSAEVADVTRATADNMRDVETAAEHLSSAMEAIAASSSQSAETTNQASHEAEQTVETISQLAERLSDIGSVVNFIQSVASQTNMLALNATIEAFRAGDVGGGFRVVASEVKSLATQTARATQEITTQIGSIQDGSNAALTAVSSIADIANDVKRLAAEILVSTRAQEAATRDIFSGLHQASAGTAQAVAGLHQITDSVQNATAAVGAARGATQSLLDDFAALETSLREFSETVRQG
jgi:phosphate transport system ATP-binding protein